MTTLEKFIPGRLPIELQFKILSYIDPIGIESILFIHELAHLHRHICLIIENFNISCAAPLLQALGHIETISRSSIGRFLRKLRRKGKLVSKSGATIFFFQTGTKGRSSQLLENSAYLTFKDKVCLLPTLNELDVKLLSDTCAFKFYMLEKMNLDVDRMDADSFSRSINYYYERLGFVQKIVNCFIRVNDAEGVLKSQYDFLKNGEIEEVVDVTFRTASRKAFLKFKQGIKRNSFDDNLRDEGLVYQDYIKRLGLLLILMLRNRIKILYHLTIDSEKEGQSVPQHDNPKSLSIHKFDIDPTLLTIRMVNSGLERLELNDCAIIGGGMPFSLANAGPMIPKVILDNPYLSQSARVLDMKQVFDLQKISNSFIFLTRNPKHELFGEILTRVPRSIRLCNFNQYFLKRLTLESINDFNNVNLPNLKQLKLVFGKTFTSKSRVSMQIVDCPIVDNLEITNKNRKKLKMSDCRIGYEAPCNGTSVLSLTDNINYNQFLKDNVHFTLCKDFTMTFTRKKRTLKTLDFGFSKARKVSLFFYVCPELRDLNRIKKLFPAVKVLTIGSDNYDMQGPLSAVYEYYFMTLRIEVVDWI